MDLVIIDPVAWVAARPMQFFRTENPDALALLPYVMNDVLFLGAGECRVSRAEGWLFVSSNGDWMRHDSISVEALFSRVVAEPGLGQHSMRSEILLNAFASDILVATRHEELLVKGQPPATALLGAQVDFAWATRSIAFRLNAR